MASVGTVLKRALLGRQVSSSKMEHTLLPKVLALPVFSSDPLSSVAYATEEMMLVLALAGASALSLMLPIAGVIAIVLVIVVTSYIQTVRAYPQGGGSYIVAKENLGTVPGLLAAGAILIGYVVTAAVSVTAGAVAVTSAFPGLREHRLTMALSFLAFIALANLRGSKESGLVFAIPTYGFVASIYATILTGIVRCLDGCPQAASSELPIESVEALSALLILRAFTSGSAALTGVEAIADGVQAFQRPRARNAATTLTIMAAISTTMFLGITFLARVLNVRTSEHLEGQSVLAQIGDTVFSGGTMFFVLQAFTALILIVAANTAYQDFPRLSAILARDGFMPTQFKNRGDRLVFSNGIILLSVFAAALVLGFSGDLTRLIALYLVGVFTAFTLSQAGMVMRWYRLREGTWRRNVAINGVGAFTTGVVLAVVIVTKFNSAWIILVVLPVIILALLGVGRHYAHVRRELVRGTVPVGVSGANRVLFVLTDVDAAAAEALGYVRAMRPESLSVAYVGSRPVDEVADRWRELAPSGPELLPVRHGGGGPVDNVLRLVRSIPREPNDFITVVIPEMFEKRSLLLAAMKPVTFRLKVRLLYEPGVVVTDVPVLATGGRPAGVDGRPLIPERVEALVFVGSVHDATVRAINYAESLNAHETRAIFLATEPEETPAFLEKWAERGIQTRLDVVEAPFRDMGPPLLEEVRRVTADRSTVAAVVLPEFLVTRWWHRILHNNRALFVKRQLLFEERVILSSVPFQLGRSRGS